MLFQGTDIPDVDDVIQFMTPRDLSVWIQRAGRAGRDGRLSRAILLVEPSVAKKLGVKPKKGRKCLKENTEGCVQSAFSSIADFPPLQTTPQPMGPTLVGLTTLIPRVPRKMMTVTTAARKAFLWGAGKSSMKTLHTRRNALLRRGDSGY